MFYPSLVNLVSSDWINEIPKNFEFVKRKWINSGKLWWVNGHLELLLTRNTTLNRHQPNVGGLFRVSSGVDWFSPESLPFVNQPSLAQGGS